MSHPWYRIRLPTKEGIGMIDPSMDIINLDEIVLDTPKPLAVVELEAKVTELEKSLKYWQDRGMTYSNQIAELEEYVKDNFSYIDEDVTQRLVEIFGLEITKDYDVEITVKFSGTISAPLNYDMDDLENALSAELNISYYSELEGDISEDNMDIDWTEA